MFADSIGFSNVSVKESFISFFPIYMPFICFSCLTALASISSIMFNRSGEIRQGCLAPDLKGNAFSLSPFGTCWLKVCVDAVYQIEKNPILYLV